MQLHQQMSVSPSVHLSTIQKVSQSVNKFNSLPVSQSTIQTVQSSHSGNQSNIISSVNQPFKQFQYHSTFDSRRNSRFLIPARIENQESGKSYRESGGGSSLTGQKTKD